MKKAPLSVRFILFAGLCLAGSISGVSAQVVVFSSGGGAGGGAVPRSASANTAKADEAKLPQIVLQGVVRDSTEKNPLAYATLSLRRDSAGVVAAAAADANGRFEMAVRLQGPYTLTASSVGYAPVSRRVVLDSEVRKLEVGDILLDNSLQAKGVTVTAQRPLVTSDIDKITYNPDADPETGSLNTLEMMRKVPLLTVDGEDNLQLKGQGNYKILLNNKTSTMLSRNYKDVLKSMPASSIKSIEVITDPPSKYDAEGVSGIININTVRRTNNGYTGNISLNSGVTGIGSGKKLPVAYGGSTYLAASVGKFNISGNYFGSTNPSVESPSGSTNLNYLSDDYYLRQDQRTSSSNYKFNGFGLETSYEIDTFNLVTLSGSGYWGSSSSDGTTLSQTFSKANQLTRSYRNTSTNNSDYGTISGNFDYQRTFKKPDKTLTFSLRGDYNPNNSGFESHIDQELNYTGFSQRSDNRANGGEYTAQIDYFDPLTKMHQVEGGMKYIQRPSISTSDRFIQDADGEWQIDPSLLNDLDYRQHIAAAYAGYLFKLKKFTAKAGLRAEYTVNDATFHLVEDQKLFNRAFNLIPYVNLGYKPTDSQNIRLSYTQRLSRPGIWDLNPYVRNSDPLNLSTGNPNLTPEVSHSFNASYGIYGAKFSFNLSGSAGFVNNAIERVETIDAQGVHLTRPDNIGQRQSYGLYSYGNVRFLKGKLNVGINLGGNYTDYRADRGTTTLHNHGWNWNGSLYAYGQPWKGGNVSGNLWAYSGYVGLQSRGSDQYSLSFSVSQAMLKQKMRVGLSINDPFRSQVSYSSTTTDPSFSSSFESIRYGRSIRLNASWRFGQMQTQVKKAKRGISNDDSRGSGNSGGTAAQ